MPEISKEHAELVLTVLMNSTPSVPLHQSIGAVGVMQSIVQGVPLPEPEKTPAPKANGKKPLPKRKKGKK
jgi:hypothetical protein